jgi:3-dehydroquinate synthase
VRLVRVRAASRAYNVLVGRECLQELGATMAAHGRDGQVVLCCDENVAPLYLEPTRKSLRGAGFLVSQVVIPAGEREKSLARAEEFYGILYDRGLRRGDVLVALGGGVIGDLVGFVAATYQRGVGLVQVPTTLLAQVDAAVGGKVAVDFRAGKNYVGTFYQPLLVLTDVSTLATLPIRELRSGAAEVAKYGLLAGGTLLDRVERLARRNLAAPRVSLDLVAGCVRRKAAVVAADEREQNGARAVLNLGHTVGHAIEAAADFTRYSHGEAVALGLRAALSLSTRLCGLPAEQAERGRDLLTGLGLPERPVNVTADEVCALIRRDKKAGREGVGYVLLRALGEPQLDVRVPADIEREVVEEMIAR